MFYGFGTLDKTRGVPKNHGFSYIAWSGILRRCHAKNFNRKDAYAGCSIDPAFKEFHDFDEWLKSQTGYGCKGFNLDKDLLKKGNRIYGPDTCVLIPHYLNGSLNRNVKLRGALPIGVVFHRGAYVARLYVKGKQTHVGTFGNAGDAFLAYKAAKENHMKSLAQEWRGQISERAYWGLMNYTVEITD